MTALEQARWAIQGLIPHAKIIISDRHMAMKAAYTALAAIDAALSAQEVPQAVPAGEWVMVPREPTEAMLDAAHEADREYTLRTFGDIMTVQQGPYDHWCAMLTAAPAAPKQAEAWQPIETAPKDGTSFLGWVAAERWSSIDGGGSGRAHDESTADFCWYVPERPDETGGYFTNASGQIGDAQDITHWMPIPSAPAAPRG